MLTNNQEDVEGVEACPAAASSEESSSGAEHVTQTNDSEDADHDVVAAASQSASTTTTTTTTTTGGIDIMDSSSKMNNNDVDKKKLGKIRIPTPPSAAASVADSFQDLVGTAKKKQLAATLPPSEDEELLTSKKEGGGGIPVSRLTAAKQYASNVADDLLLENSNPQQTQLQRQNRPGAAASTTSLPGAFSMRHGPDGHLEVGGGSDGSSRDNNSLVFGLSEEDDDDDGAVSGDDLENQRRRRGSRSRPTTGSAGVASRTTAAASGGNDDDDEEEGNGNDAPMNEDSRAGLARARPVDENEVPIQVHDTPVTPVVGDDQERKRQQQQNRFLYVMALFGIACVALGFVFGFVLGNNNNQTPTEPAAKGDASGASSLTLAPSFLSPTSQVPTSAPTDYLDTFRQQLPIHTLQNLQDISTPQWKAWDWLSRHPELEQQDDDDGMPLWRQGQLFALACFFFAMEGPTAWPEVIRTRWLRYDRNECFWYSSEFGWFDDDGTYHEGAAFYGVEPCNEKGEIQVLALEKLGLEGFLPFLPPEIEYLKALTYLQLRLNDIQVGLSDFLPSQIYNMSSIIVLNLNYNGITGTVPSDMGRLTNLIELELWDNSFSGAIPSELGLFSDMKIFDLAFNELTGTLPSELALMSNIDDALYLQNNKLTGPLPSQMGLLSNLNAFHLENNMLTGAIPSQIGMMTSVIGLWLYENNFSGVLPSELGLLLNATQMSLTHNDFEGSMPLELCPWDCQEKISPFPREGFLGRNTSVSSDGCDCTVGTTYPLSGTTNEVVINVLYDGWPEETTIVFEEFEDQNQTWVLLLNVSVGDGPDTGSHLRYRMSSFSQTSLASNTLYRFQATDDWGDGICCGGGLSITNGTAPESEIGTPYDGYRGTIMWSTLAFEDFMVEVFLWVDENGHVSVVSEEEGINLTSIEGTASEGDTQQENLNEDDSSINNDGSETHLTTFSDLLP